MPCLDVEEACTEPMTPLLSTPKGKPMVFSPFSQASTAPPCSPVLALLPDPYFKYGRWPVRSLSGVSTEAPEENDDNCEYCHPVEELLMEGPTDKGPMCSESELGSGSQEVYNLEEWLERLLRDDDVEEDEGRDEMKPREFIVDNQELCADTIGLAYRFSKNMLDRDRDLPGPPWGSSVWGIDTGDGWVQVGARFLPRELNGSAVMVEACSFAELSAGGPALTATGRVVNLSDGSAVVFAHDKASARGAEGARELRVMHLALRAMRRASEASAAAERIENEEAVALDIDGTIHGSLPRPIDVGSVPADRAKAFHRKLQKRRRAKQVALDADAPLCTGPDGKVFLLLPVLNSLQDMQRVWRKRCLARRVGPVEDAASDTEPEALVIDECGVIHA